VFSAITGAWGDEDLITGAFEIEEYEGGDSFEAGGIAIAAHSVRHVGATHAIELTGAGGERVVIGADGRYSDELIAAASGADLLVAEATLPDPDPAQHVHMSAEETGRLASAAGVGRLLLTHISDELDAERSRSIAAEAFGGAVEVAVSGADYEV
jgi:ribonuclease BN (tRNA processing enzyme)